MVRNPISVGRRKRVCSITCPTCSRSLHASCSTCCRASRALFCRASRASCLRALVPRALCSLVLHVPPTLHALLLTTMISNLYHGDFSMPLLKEYYYSGFFISDLSLQDPLTYVNVTTLIQQQPAFIRKPALWRAC